MIPNINIINEEISDADLRNEFAKIQKLVRFILTKGIESDNVIEIGQWLVENDMIHSDDGDVGLSTRDTGADDIRFWAGDAIDGLPKFKVTKSGILTAVGAFFLSALGYPRVEINSTDNLIAAFADADTYISFLPNYSGSIPTLVLVDAGTTKAFLNRPNASSGTTLGTFDGESLAFQASGNLNLSSGGNLTIDNTAGYTGSVTYVKNVVAGAPSFGTLTFKKGILTSVS